MHNLHCFLAKKKGISSVSDLHYILNLPSRIIGSTRGLLTQGTRTETRDSEEKYCMLAAIMVKLKRKSGPIDEIFIPPPPLENTALLPVSLECSF